MSVVQGNSHRCAAKKGEKGRVWLLAGTGAGSCTLTYLRALTATLEAACRVTHDAAQPTTSVDPAFGKPFCFSVRKTSLRVYGHAVERSAQLFSDWGRILDTLSC